MHFIVAYVFLLPAMISMKCMFQQLEQRYVRAEKFREKQDMKLKTTCLEVNSSLTVKFIDKVTKIKLRAFCNVNINDYKSKALNLVLKQTISNFTQMNLVPEI